MRSRKSVLAQNLCRKIEIHGNLYDERIIAYVRKLKAPTKPRKRDDGHGTMPGGMEYVVQLMPGFGTHPDNPGTEKLWLTKEEGLDVIDQLKWSPEDEEESNDSK